MPTIAIAGAGPALGFSIAKVFGDHGFDVALIARNQQKLDTLVAQLTADGILAAGFRADVTDRPALHQALHSAEDRFDGMDVLVYSPKADTGALTPVDVMLATPENVQPHLEFYLYGAMTAAAAVLPAMLDRGTGTLLFTTGAGSIRPVPYFGNVTAATAALRNWALNLGEAVSPRGIHVAHVAIDLWIGNDAPEGMDSMPASEIAPLYWDLYTSRSEHELVVRRPTISPARSKLSG